MPVLLSKKEETILADIIYDVTSSTGLSFTSPGGKYRALVQSISNKIGRLSTQKDIDLIMAFLPGAQDKYLDYFGELLALPRLGAETASVNSVHKNIKFYVGSGTFGDLNSGSSIFIPAGTLIGTQSGGSGISYRVTYDTLLLSTDSEMYVSVQSLQPGSGGNVGANKLKYHNFTAYTLSSNNGLFVTNEYEIINGKDIEDSENYRYRLSNVVTAAESANRVAVRLAILGIPGVADLVFIPYARGIGSFDVIIKTVSPRPSPTLFSQIIESVSKVAADGIYYVIRDAKKVGISMSMTLRTKNILSDSDKATIVQNIQRSLTSYINNLDIQEEFVINEVVQRVMEVDDRIKDMGIPTKPLDQIYLYKDSRVEDGRIRETLTQNYVPKNDERVIVEYEGITGDPIVINWAN